MEASSSSTNHSRSISLPSRLTHPSFTNIQTKINALKRFENFVGSSESIQSGLTGLAELYVFLNELVRSPQNQQVLSRHQNETLVEAALEVSIVLLDSCTNLKDLIMLIKENVQILQLALKRKGGDSKVASQIAAYLCCRKKAKKIVSKSLMTLKNLEKKIVSFLFLDADRHHVSMVTKVLGEANSLTISLFRSILVFLSNEPKRCKGVEFISKLVYKNTYEKHQRFLTEVETIDVGLTILHKNMRNGEINDGDVQTTILRRLQTLDASLEGFGAGLECVFRRLVQNRSSLLNIVVC